MSCSRRYVYRYSEQDDEISVWFVSAMDGETVESLFHELKFDDGGGDACRETSHFWSAKAYHLCQADQYHSEYLFQFRGAVLEGWQLQHHVHGPRKVYTSHSQCCR